MKTIGIKLADGSFFPVLQEGHPDQKKLELTTAHNNQTRVMVDLYRSEEGSMDDAEYVDTLQIDNINEHPRGDASIAFNVAIDENNELSANIIDEETGIESKTTIELVNRTLEERMAEEVSDYDITETSVSEDEVMLPPEMPLDDMVEETPAAESAVESAVEETDSIASGAVAGGGLLAAAMVFNESKESQNTSSEEEPVVEETLVEEPASEGLPEDFHLEETDNIPNGEEEFELPDFSTEVPEEDPLRDLSLSEETISEETVTEETVPEEDPLRDLPLPEETISEETVTEETVPEKDPLRDLSFPEETPVEETSADTTLDDFSIDTVPEESTSEDTFTTDDLDLPDFTEETTEGITAAAEAAMWDEPVEDNSSLFDLPDFEEEQVSGSAADPEMEWDFDDELTRAENTTSYETAPANGLSFTGLYDKETELGESENEEEGDSKKRKTSVIICVICAIICIIAVLLILFVIPSKLNVLKRGHSDEEPVAVETPEVEPEEELVPEEEPEPEPEPVIETSAKEDEIVIIEEAEEVKPEPPAPPKEEPKPDIIYKIKWGDTLWDIADTYYKNPWRYKKIARYNGIKDPDYIISGTKIKIPQE